MGFKVRWGKVLGSPSFLLYLLCGPVKVTVKVARTRKFEFQIINK